MSSCNVPACVVPAVSCAASTVGVLYATPGHAPDAPTPSNDHDSLVLPATLPAPQHDLPSDTAVSRNNADNADSSDPEQTSLRNSDTSSKLASPSRLLPPNITPVQRILG